MTVSARERAGLYVPVMVLSAATWMMLLVNPRSIMTLSHCPVTDSGASLVSVRMLLRMNPISPLMVGWALMLVAMMSPALIAPFRHVLDRSFKRRRARSIALFAAGYAAIWMVAGVGLIVVILALGLLAPRSYLPAVTVSIIA